MSNGCPHHSNGTIVPTIETHRLFHAGKLTQPAEQKYEQYANFAIAFDQFVKGNSENILKNIDELYDEGISRYTYMIRTRKILYDEIMMTRYGDTLNTGISTFFLMINGLFQSSPDIIEEDVYRKMLQFMGSINRGSLPGSQKLDIEKRYADYVHALLQPSIPDGYLKTANQKKKNIPCPIIFTENGKKFLKNIIGLVYKHFPLG